MVEFQGRDVERVAKQDGFELKVVVGRTRESPKNSARVDKSNDPESGIANG
jgi:hypothetical protein